MPMQMKIRRDTNRRKNGHPRDTYRGKTKKIWPLVPGGIENKNNEHPGLWFSGMMPMRGGVLDGFKMRPLRAHG